MKSWMKSPNSTLNLSTTEDSSGGGSGMESSKRRYFMQSATKNPFDEKPDEDENEDFFTGSLVKLVFQLPSNIICMNGTLVWLEVWNHVVWLR